MTSFMSGLVSGFMSTFGAGGGFGDMGAAGDAAGAAGGVAGSAGADTGASSIAADSSTAGSQMAASNTGAPTQSSGGGGPLGGMGGGGSGGGLGGIMGGGSKAPATSTVQGGGAAGSVSPNANVSGTSAANMSSPGMQPDSSGIIRQNPYGQDPTKSPSTMDYIKKGVQGYQQGQQQGKGSGEINVPPMQMPNNTYGAIFGSQTSVGDYGGGRVGVMAPNMNQQAMSSASLAPPPAMQAPQQPAPMQLSDRRAKTKIHKGNKDLENLLDRVYTNVTNKGKR